MTNILQFSARYARHLNISRSGESATIIILPVVQIERHAEAEPIVAISKRLRRYVSRSVCEQMRSDGVFSFAEGGDA